MKKIIRIVISSLVVLYVIICVSIFFYQERLIFFPQKLDKDFQFQFDQHFIEQNITTSDGVVLNGLLFKADSSKGLIFYLHGNSGNVNTYGRIAQTYTSLNYDLFMLDYREYGKSEGSMSGEFQFFQDIQLAYDEQKKVYDEDNIIILGYSIGTGPATKIASTNNPKLLILNAPYYSLIDMMRRGFPLIPTFLLKYKFETYKYLKECEVPVVIFHGDNDQEIYYGASLKLLNEFKSTDTLITLKGHGHDDLESNPDYLVEMERILSK